eukprot:7999139-Alexandrium_andersonii.AAC.1
MAPPGGPCRAFSLRFHGLGHVRAIPKLGADSQLAACRVRKAAHGFPALVTFYGRSAPMNV